MSAPKIGPDIGTLRAWTEAEGLTHQQCADRWFEQTGLRVKRAAISATIRRAGEAKTAKVFTRTIPWIVKVRHQRRHQVLMLRALGHRLNGTENPARNDDMLDKWLREIRADKVIVGYDPDSDDGFFYIDSKYRDHRDLKVPIRVAELRNMDRRKSA